jgi:hypothetical protein
MQEGSSDGQPSLHAAHSNVGTANSKKILLYETSVSNGLLAHEPISITAGYEEVYIFC